MNIVYFWLWTLNEIVINAHRPPQAKNFRNWLHNTRKQLAWFGSFKDQGEFIKTGGIPFNKGYCQYMAGHFSRMLQKTFKICTLITVTFTLLSVHGGPFFAHAPKKHLKFVGTLITVTFTLFLVG